MNDTSLTFKTQIENRSNAQSEINFIHHIIYTHKPTHTFSMDPMVSGGKRRLVVTDGSQCLSGGYRWLRLCRWIEVVEVQAAAQTNFMADHLVHVALYGREFIQVDVELVKRQM